MEKIEISELRGVEVLAKDVFYDSILLMSTGTTLKKEYIARLQDLDIRTVYIEDRETKKEGAARTGEKRETITHEKPDRVTVLDLSEEPAETEMQKNCCSMARKVLESYSCMANEALNEILSVAEDILTTVLETPEVVYNLSKVREQSDNRFSHSVSVATLSVLLGKKLKLTTKRLLNLATGALLHDIGYLYLPFTCENTSIDSYDEEQRKEIYKHVVYGYSAVEFETWLSASAKEIILSHHERLDGSGYPMGLQGKKLSLECRLVGLCDFLDAAVYGYFTKKQTIDQLIHWLRADGGSRFDEKLVSIFLTCIAHYPSGTIVRLDNGELGVVIRQNLKDLEHPVVKLLSHKDGSVYRKYVELDLAQAESPAIMATVETRRK